MKVLALLLLTLFSISCGNNVPVDTSTGRTLTYEGYLHGDSAQGTSAIEYNNKFYKIGDKSTGNIANAIQDVSIGNTQATILQSSGSVKIVAIEFDGAIEEGSVPTIQVYKYILK